MSSDVPNSRMWLGNEILLINQLVAETVEKQSQDLRFPFAWSRVAMGSRHARGIIFYEFGQNSRFRGL